MSVDLSLEHVCYVNCNFCNTILAVSVPCNNLLTIVTVRCGHCANLLNVNMGGFHLQDPLVSQFQKKQQEMVNNPEDSSMESSSSSESIKFSPFHHNPLPPIPPPEKRQRIPSAYNRFIKEEIQRIKANNPDITHRQAFSTAAKNWAHFPHIHFGMKQDQLDNTAQKSVFY